MVTERCSPDYSMALDLISSAYTHIDDSKAILAIRTRPAISSAYNAMLQASNALMKLDGKITVTKEHHKEMVDFIRNNYNTKIASDLIDTFDNGRRLRNYLQYKNAKPISFRDAHRFLIDAERFVTSIKKIIRTKNKIIQTHI